MSRAWLRQSLLVRAVACYRRLLTTSSCLSYDIALAVQLLPLGYPNSVMIFSILTHARPSITKSLLNLVVDEALDKEVLESRCPLNRLLPARYDA